MNASLGCCCAEPLHGSGVTLDGLLSSSRFEVPMREHRTPCVNATLHEVKAGRHFTYNDDRVCQGCRSRSAPGRSGATQGAVPSAGAPLPASSDLPVVGARTAFRGQVGSPWKGTEGGRSHRLASLAFSRRIRWSPLRQALIELGRQT